MKDKYEILVNWHSGYTVRHFDFTEEEANLVQETLNKLFSDQKKDSYAPDFLITNISANERKRAAQIAELKKQEEEAHLKEVMQNGAIAQAFKKAGYVEDIQ